MHGVYVFHRAQKGKQLDVNLSGSSFPLLSLGEMKVSGLIETHRTNYLLNKEQQCSGMYCVMVAIPTFFCFIFLHNTVTTQMI